MPLLLVCQLPPLRFGLLTDVAGHNCGLSGPSGATSDDGAVGAAAVKAKASNKNFDFTCADYELMRDSGKPYSGDPRVNKLLPLPRPTCRQLAAWLRGLARSRTDLPAS